MFFHYWFALFEDHSNFYYIYVIQNGPPEGEQAQADEMLSILILNN